LSHLGVDAQLTYLLLERCKNERRKSGTEAGERTFLLLWLEPNFSPPYVHISGFTPGAKDLFKQENYLALYRLPSDEMVKETILGKLSSITKRRPPLSHMINLFVKDTTTSKAAPFFGHLLGMGGPFPQSLVF